ncbi:hypothetical protein GFL60_25920 [Rhizobium leguminosarum bv. viciae]|nr:hypothetical protein [Rhizobium leguminosarum bv. viciae]
MTTWNLCPLQMASLRWLARGKTIAVISQIEGRRVDDIERCLNDALLLLGVQTLDDAFRKIEIARCDRT